MSSPDVPAPRLTIPAIQISYGALLFLCLVAVVVIVVSCQVFYPGKLEAFFHVPPGIDGSTTLELIILKIFVLVCFLIVLKDILVRKLLS